MDLLESTIAKSVHSAENRPSWREDQPDHEESSIEQSPSSEELRDELSTAKEAMMDLQGEIKRLRRKMEKTVEKYEVQRRKEELSRFVRVPNEHSASSTCTYQEDVEYDKYGEPIYGEIPPTAMPR